MIDCWMSLLKFVGSSSEADAGVLADGRKPRWKRTARQSNRVQVNMPRNLLILGRDALVICPQDFKPRQSLTRSGPSMKAAVRCSRAGEALSRPAEDYQLRIKAVRGGLEAELE